MQKQNRKEVSDFFIHYAFEMQKNKCNGTSLFFPLWFLILLLLLWLLLAQFGDVDLLLALHHRFRQQLKHIVQMGVDLMKISREFCVTEQCCQTQQRRANVQVSQRVNMFLI